MEDLRVERYNEASKTAWDDFVSRLEAHSILFYRDFMEYHSNRFKDYSLLMFQKNKLVAVLPANIDADGNFHSHEGLSYGGFLFEPFTRLDVRMLVYNLVLRFLNKVGIEKIWIKSIPNFYTTDHVEQLILHWLKAKRECSHVYTYFPLGTYSSSNKGRKEGIKNGKQLHLDIRQSTDFKTFWDTVLIPNLDERFGVKPVHTADEIERLSKKFPNQIQLFGAFQGESIRAGIVVFVHKDVAHAQYVASDKNRNDGSLDFLIDAVIRRFNSEQIFSFGTSSENHGNTVNKGLLYWKESFRTSNDIQEFYSIQTKNYLLLENRLI